MPYSSILLAGLLYSGTKILGFILGSHPSIYNGADLHHLNKDRKGKCSVHNDECSVFNQSNRKSIFSEVVPSAEWFAKIESQLFVRSLPLFLISVQK